MLTVGQIHGGNAANIIPDSAFMEGTLRTNDKEERVGRKLITQYRSAQFTGLDIKHYIYANGIKTILTKESYMTNCYKVGGEDGI